MGQLDFFWAASGFFFFLVAVVFPPLIITMCEGWIWVRWQFIFVTDTRTGKLSAWFIEGRKTDLINVIFEPGGRTMAKRTGLLFPLLYFMAEFTSQQVLRIGKCNNFLSLLPPAKHAQTALLKSSASLLLTLVMTEQPRFWCFQKNKKTKLIIYLGGCCLFFGISCYIL